MEDAALINRTEGFVFKNSLKCHVVGLIKNLLLNIADK